MDHQIFSSQKYGGISRVFTMLYIHFQKRDDIESKIPVFYSDNAYLKEVKKVRDLPKKLELPFKKTFFRVVNQILTVVYMLINDYDVFQPTYYCTGFLKFLGKKPYLLVVHDMIHEIMPQYLSRPEQIVKRKKRLIERAAKIVVISENTKRDIIEIYKTDPEKVEVIYWGSSLNLSGATAPKGCVLPQNYILFVGNRLGYKNFERFAKAIRELLLDRKDLWLVCAGGGAFSHKEKRFLREIGVEKKVRQIYFKDDNELAYMYSKATVFVFPSLYEGFGLPILEAFSCNCPVVLSKASSFPEIAGDAAVYFDPRDINSIRVTIKSTIDDKEGREGMIKVGQERLKIFSWERTAREYTRVYKSILNNNS